MLPSAFRVPPEPVVTPAGKQALSARRKERKAKGTEAKAAALVASLSAPPLTRPSTALGIRPRAGSGALDSTCEITPPPP